METFDRFEIRISQSFLPWTLGKGLCVAEIYINNQSLIELVREFEEAFVQAEINERRAEGDDIDELAFPAGDYLYLPPSMVLLPSRNLLDEPWNHGFSLESNNLQTGKAIVLGCTCGVIQCWFMQVRITLNKSTVEWADFGQFHRDWQYNLGPFKFDRKQYVSELYRQS
ncbi:hypothetical protein [Nostoc sp. 'Peltigera membranacea cyanobiont' N6]|uniref:hypothetical protein n=1 Tax=Nostoc sp. 'Peltigera membranacea cyanobiont' N6 TaxID=1261031 RepID=UPI000CF3153A|nr:hypothetical protein [Nostoc sp. 'Peltigera membranacea cyanobiont' N6]AVH62898.1 hypothetical protein NPM_1057 [Nostoc sp. 'Peltigera membranacea cyanobiont' N6]